MPTGYVSTTHVSGGMVFSDVIPDRVHLKIGVAEGGEVNKVYEVANFTQAKNFFQKGILLDSLQQYFEEFDESLGQKPVPVLCVRPVNDVPGIVNTPSKVGTGLATASVSGTPTGNRTVKLLITKAGASGVAEYRKSVDGGSTFGSTLVTPASGSAIALDVGATITFTDAVTPSDSFKVDDVWTVIIDAPSASASEFLVSLNAVKREYRSYWIHVIHPADRAFAVSVNTILLEMETDHNLPSFAILEVRTKEDAESVADYFQFLIDEFDPFFSDRVSIVVSEGRYVAGGIEAQGGYEILRSLSVPIGVWKNAATLLTAKLASGAVNVSAAYVMEKRSLTVNEIRYWNEGYRDWMDLLHDKRFTVLKEYNDYEGVFVARDRIKSLPDSDFAEIPERRRADKMHRIVYRESIPFLNQDSNLNSGSGGIKYIKAVVDAKVSSEMEVNGKQEISKHEIEFDPNKNFILTNILEAKLKMFVAGRIKAIEWTTSFASTN